MKYKKIVTYLLENDDTSNFVSLVKCANGISPYSVEEIRIYEDSEEASDALRMACAEGEYTEFCYSCADEALRVICKTMNQDDINAAIKSSYHQEDWFVNREHLLVVLSSNYPEFKYDNALKHILKQAISDECIDIRISAMDCATQYFKEEFIPVLIERGRPTDYLERNIWDNLIAR